ncbi:MAG: bifunctional UDP-N-acetylglucosamine diphosphorylase/glucosamine-1-phosphate N-acetyltransferase GlmU [Thermoleophilia bacterium]
MQSVPAEETKRALAVVVLAAGLGMRMKSKTPKVLHPLCGRPMIGWISEAVAAVEPERTLVVLAPGVDDVHQYLPQTARIVIQEKQLGTGDALRACEAALADFAGDVLVVYGDTPLLTGEELQGLLATHAAGEPACTVMTVDVAEPDHYGRVFRDADGRVIRIVEHRDASEAEQKICEVNAGVYVFEAPALWEALSEVGNANDQGEVYLTDVIGIMANRSQVVLAHKVDDDTVTLGVNSRLDLARAARLMQRRILERHMLAGVTVTDPDSTYVDYGVSIGRDTVLEPMTVLTGATQIGGDCVVGPSSRLEDTTVDDGSRVTASHAIGAEIGAGCRVGPFAYLRPGARLAASARAGTFVEIKNTDVGPGARVPHLSYIGDAEIGAGTNVAAGNITANYDGANKHRTIIGSGVNTGADTVFVAPVNVGDGAMTAAGSVITDDVPAGALGIGRARQKNIADYAREKSNTHKGEGDREE